MAERINKLILEIETQATGNLAPTVKQINDLQTATKAAAGDTLKLVEAEKKLEQAAAQAGTSISTETKKQSDFAKAVQSTSQAMKEIGQTNALKDSFAKVGVSASQATKLVEDFKKQLEGVTKISDIDRLANDFKKSVLALDQAGAGEVIDKIVEASIDARTALVELSKQKFINAPAATDAEKRVITLQSQLRKLRDEAAKTTDPVLFQRLSVEAAKLEDKIGKTNDLIKALSSDNFFADTIVEGAKSATAAFSVLQGAATFFAEDNEELAIAAQKAQGALSLLVGTQAILTDLKKGDNIITRAQILAQRAYTFVVGESIVATKGFKIALAATGIGAAVLIVTTLVAAFTKLNDEIKKNNSERDRQNRISQSTIENYSKEAAGIEIAKAKLKDANTTQEQRTQIISDLQKQYPSYLKNIDAEKSSYEDIETALNKVNDALFLKFSIQAKEEELVELFKQRNTAERVYQESLKITSERLKEVNASQDISAENLERAQGLAEGFGAGISGSLQSEVKNIDKTITSIIDSIVEDSKKLSDAGGDPLGGAAKNAEKNKQVLEGTIAFLQKQVNDLSDSLTNDLLLGSEAFDDTVKKFLAAQELLDEAKARLGKPKDIEVFTPGSIALLQKQLSDLRVIFDSLGDDEARGKIAAQIITAQEEIDRINALFFGEKEAQQEEFNTAFLDNEESFQLEFSSINEEGEIDRINIRLAFARERLQILQEQGKGETDEAQAIQNQITLLEAQGAKLRRDIRKKELEERIQQATQFVQQVATAVSQVISLRQQEADRLTDIQQQRVSEAEKIAERGNVAVLRAEQERLDELNKKNERFAQQQIALAQIQLIAESALAVAKAAGQGGAAAAFTIAATLIALAAGFAQARAQSQAVAASFYEGGEYGYTGDGNPRQESRKLGKKPYTYHKSEYITPHEVLAIGNNKEWFKKIHLQRLDIDQLIGGQRPNVVVNTGSKEIVDAINSIPGISISPNARAFFNLTEKHKKVQDKRTRLKNWKR